ncbi:C40 family peptidase [Sanguibacter suaedae]|uniref:C40 family peptidase n=1 Tax=Sanguibacter suaedae TaxID=2795737 RepID=A0A934M871_9MICO|nr:C40 family peptidase [Sanguibacter suaedae]MBI9116217.1 C40 family peptidase [Sanguibacter suaedae]
MAPTRRPHRWRTATAVALAATVLAGTIPTAAADPAPSDDDVETAHQAVVDAAASVAAMDVRLAELAAAQDVAYAALETAAEAYNQAVVDHDAAVLAADDATERSTTANERAEESRTLLVGLARDSSRSGSGLDRIGMYLTADGLEDAVSASDAMALVGTKADKAVQQYQADSTVAETLQGLADQAVADQADAKAAADAALQAAADAQADADQAVAHADAERAVLLGQLAEARSTSVAVEAARQDALAAERAARDEAAARDRIEAQVPAHPAAGTAPSPGASPAAGAAPTSPTAPAPTVPAPTRPAPAAPAPARPAVTPAPPAVAPAPARPAPAEPAAAPAAPAPPAPAPAAPPAPTVPVGGGLGSGSSRGSAGQGQAAVDWARSQVGVPYGWGGTGPGSYDCSGLTSKAWAAAGLSINRTSRDQYRQAQKISLSSMRPGDLVFWANNTNDPSTITHVAMYAGNGQIVEASRPGVPVRVTAMRWDSRLMPFAGRP